MMHKNILLVLSLTILHSAAFAQQEGVAYNSHIPIHYKIFGKGKPVLIINGGPGMNSNGFADLAMKLSSNNQAIIYDQRGTGKSEMDHADSSNMTMDLMISDIEALRKKLNIDKWIILGHSFGGMLASYYATKYPQHIRALVLSSSGGIDLNLLNYVSKNIDAKLNRIERDSLAFWNRKIANGDTAYSSRLGRGRNLAAAYVYHREFIPVLAERLTQGNSQINNLLWADMQHKHFDCSNGLQHFEKPVLIFHGQNDILEKRTAEKAAGVLKNSQLVVLPNCGHYGWLDSPEVYFSHLNKFLAAN
ncbi:MAG: Proline iminopeptidase [Ferruginibacter sp.]|nr:Proline iminopeptidase [Ferruginibacter sp.]